MTKTFVVAAAPLTQVQVVVEELSSQGYAKQNMCIVSTRRYRIDGVDDYIDIEEQNFSEACQISVGEDDSIVVAQFNENLISYVNVYRFLRANKVSEFAIKVAGSPLIKTSVAKVFDLFSHDDGAEDNAVRWISPDAIKLRYEFSQAQHGQILDGDWDLDAEEFEKTVLFYESLKQRITERKDWSETEYYRDVMQSLQQGNRRFGCSNLEQFEAYCGKLDRLFDDMKQNGWQQHSDSDYVTINIGRDGTILFNDGRHRLSMAKLLGIKSIPVKVAVRHRDWQEFKNEIRAFADKFYGGKVYAKIHHVDLQDMPFSQEDHRLEVILKHLNPSAKTVLDIGSHWGYFCNGLEEHGYDCTAVEADVSNYYFLDKLKIAQGSKFNAVNASIFDFVNAPSKFDAVLALNIFHHFIKSEALHQSLKTLLANLEMGEMYFQTHNPVEPQMKGSYRNYASEEFVDFVLANSCLTQKMLLIEYPNGRKLYRLSC